jgi:hypothetical protein
MNLLMLSSKTPFVTLTQAEYEQLASGFSQIQCYD